MVQKVKTKMNKSVISIIPGGGIAKRSLVGSKRTTMSKNNESSSNIGDNLQK